MARVPVETTMFGLEVRTKPLPVAVSQPLIPEAYDFMKRAIAELGPMAGDLAGLLGDGGKGIDPEKAARLLSALGSARNDGNGKAMMDTLVRHARTLLQGTVVIAPDASNRLVTYDLSDDAQRTELFEEREYLFLPLVLFAGKVTFGRYFFVPDRPDAKATTG